MLGSRKNGARAERRSVLCSANRRSDGGHGTRMGWDTFAEEPERTNKNCTLYLSDGERNPAT